MSKLTVKKSRRKNSVAALDRDVGGLALTEDLAEAVARQFWSAYLAGQYGNSMPPLKPKTKTKNSDEKEEMPWVPGESYTAGYVLGLTRRYVFNGAYGPQYQFQVRVGSDRTVARGLAKESIAALAHWLGMICLDLCRTMDTTIKILAPRMVDVDSITPADFSDWFAVTTGRLPRLTSGSGRAKRKTGSALTISDRIANVVAAGKASGCIACFVTAPDDRAVTRALSAGHVVTCFGTAPNDTTVQRVSTAPPENIGNYLRPHPFLFPRGGTVSCDAAVVDLFSKIEFSNTVSFSGRKLKLFDSYAGTTTQLQNDHPQLGVVRQDQKVTSANFVAANGRMIMLDRKDYTYAYDQLIEFGVYPQRPKRDRQVVLPGDSGALVFLKPENKEDARITGLGIVVGGQQAGGNLSLGYCIGLEFVLTQLGMEIVP